MSSDLNKFLLWILMTIVIIGFFDSIYYKNRPVDNEEENLIVRPSYDHSSFSVLPGKQE